MTPHLFVLDCSVAAKWVLPEPDRDSALALLDQYESGEISLIAPDLLMAEFASLLAKHNRRKQLSAQQVHYAFELLSRSAPKLVDMRPRLMQALELSLLHQMSLWDCVYVALAEEYDCLMLTADRRLFRAGKGRHPRLRLLS